MNLTPTAIYWILQADSFVIASLILALVFGSVMLFGFVATCIDDESKLGCGLSLFAAFLMFVFIAAAAFIPSTRTLTAMYVLPPIINNDVVQKDIPECVKALIQNVISNAAPAAEKTKEAEE